MRGILIFFAVVAVSVVLVACVAFALGAPVLVAVLACLAGAIATIIASIIVNTRNAAIYGRQVWEDQGGMDGVASHDEHMRRDRVRRHAETHVTFPAGDPA